MKIITMNTAAALVRDIYANTTKSAVAVRLFAAANNHTLKDPQGILYADDFVGDDDVTLRDWDDTERTGEVYSAQDFLKGAKLWGVNLEDTIGGEDAISVYIFREDMPD